MDSKTGGYRISEDIRGRCSKTRRQYLHLVRTSYTSIDVSKATKQTLPFLSTACSHITLASLKHRIPQGNGKKREGKERGEKSLANVTIYSKWTALKYKLLSCCELITLIFSLMSRKDILITYIQS